MIKYAKTVENPTPYAPEFIEGFYAAGILNYQETRGFYLQGNLKLHERLQNTYADCSRVQKYIIRYGISGVYIAIVLALIFYMIQTEVNYIYPAIAVYYGLSTPVLYYVYKKRMDLRISREEDWDKYRRNQKMGLICGCAIIAINVLCFPAFF